MPKGGIRGANQPNVTRLSTNTTYRHGSSLPSIEQAMQLRLPMASHPPTGPKQAAATGYRCQARHREEQLRLLIMNPRLAPSGCRPLALERIAACHRCRAMSCVAASTSHCKTHTESTRKQEHLSRETSKPQHNPKCDAFRKGVTPMAPQSHVPNGLGFLPWMSTPGETRRPQ